ncbi:MAG: hypothetical protein J4F46_08620 [Dehalococcoidia bacterium]|nr:hypothetical protein [Dehalococcoidia bacterium]
MAIRLRQLKRLLSMTSQKLVVLAPLLVLAALGLTGWFVFAGDKPQLSAQELFNGCERTAETDFDFLVTIHGNERLGYDDTIVTVTFDGQVSGEDIYMLATVGERSREVIYVDKVMYSRDPGGAWVANPQSKMSLAGMLSGFESPVVLESDNPLCLELGPVATVSEHHYRLTATGVGAPDGPTGWVDENTYITQGQDITWDYWLNEDGQLLKMQQISTLTGNTDAGQQSITTVISGVGEPNVIERPPGV